MTQKVQRCLELTRQIVRLTYERERRDLELARLICQVTDERDQLKQGLNREEMQVLICALCDDAPMAAGPIIDDALPF